MRGLAKVTEQCLLAAACQNMKKIAMILALITAETGKRGLWRRISALMRSAIAPHAANPMMGAAAA